MNFDDCYDAWVDAESAAREANDEVFQRVHGDGTQMTDLEGDALQALRNEAQARMHHMMVVANGHDSRPASLRS